MNWKDRARQIKQQHPLPRFGRNSIHRMLLSEGYAVSAPSVGRWLKKYYHGSAAACEGQKLETDFREDRATITAKSLNIQTLEQALDASDVDLDIWEVDRHVINSWEMTTKEGVCYTNYQVKVWLKRRETDPLFESLDLIVDELRRLSPRLPCPKPQGDHLLEISIFDHHFGKLAWHEETGNDYDLKIAQGLFIDAVATLLQRAQVFGVSQILLPIGNDFLHVDGPENMTSAGTPQDADSRYAKIFSKAKIAFIEAVHLCLSVAPVKVIWIGSNHDMTASYALAQVVDAYFHNTKGVTVDAGADPRKFERYGTCLLGFTHGNEEKMADLPLIMATTTPQDWAATTHREWHIGHLHKKKETRFNAGDTWNGVAVRILPSLSGTDAWHHRKGYCNNHRAAEAYLWHYHTGYAGHLSVNAKELT